MFKLRLADVFENASCFSLNKYNTKNVYFGTGYTKDIRITDKICGTKIQGI